jgi:hypothetical protein
VFVVILHVAHNEGAAWRDGEEDRWFEIVCMKSADCCVSSEVYSSINWSP